MPKLGQINNTQYFIWRYIVLQPLYMVTVFIILQYITFSSNYLTNFWDNIIQFFFRFGLILLTSLFTFIFEAFLKKMNNQQIFKQSKDMGSYLIKQLLRALILSASIVATISLLLSGSGDPIRAIDGWIQINGYYVLVYSVTYLVVTIVVSLATQI